MSKEGATRDGGLIEFTNSTYTYSHSYLPSTALSSLGACPLSLQLSHLIRRFPAGTLKISVEKQNAGRGVTKFGGPRNSGVRSPFEETLVVDRAE